MTSAGRICPLPKGNWAVGTTYDFLDFVNYNGKTYIAKRINTGKIPPSSTDDWQLFAGSVDAALQYISSIPFSGLSSASKTKGYVYNISTAFVTTAEFVEGAGHSYAAGANVMWVGDKWDVLSGNRDIATISVSIGTSGWVGSGPFTLTVSDPKFHDRTSLIVPNIPSTTPVATVKAYRKAFALLMGATVGEGTATFAASAKPATAITINLVQGA